MQVPALAGGLSVSSTQRQLPTRPGLTREGASPICSSPIRWNTGRLADADKAFSEALTIYRETTPPRSAASAPRTPCHPEPARPPSPLTHPPTATTRIHCRMPTYGQRSAESPGQRLPALVWKIHLLHGAQTRLVQNAAITGDAPGTLSRLGTERIQGQCAALL